MIRGMIIVIITLLLIGIAFLEGYLMGFNDGYLSAVVDIEILGMNALEYLMERFGPER